MGALQDAVVGRIAELENSLGSRRKVAATLGVDPGTITRWADPEIKQRPNLGNCLKIDELLPDAEQPLADLWFTDLATREGVEHASEFISRLRSVFVRPDFVAGGDSGIDQAIAGYKRATAALTQDPPRPHPKRIRHCAFHLGDVDTPEPPQELKPHLAAFADAMTRRILEGWDVRTVYFVPTARRLRLIFEERCQFDNLYYEVRGVQAPAVPALAALIVSDTHCFWAYDNNGASRAGDVLEFKERPEMVAWSLRYFDTVFGSPSRGVYVLRDKHGPREDEYRRMSQRFSR
jgi:hypothetical protein